MCLKLKRIAIFLASIFRKDDEYTMSGGDEKNKGTFIVKIMNRKHSTWQGNVTWVEEEKAQNFRSALELLKMIDEALDQDLENKTKGGNHEG